MKKVFNKVIAIAATVPLALTQGFAVMANAADATTISVERVLEIKPQELESDWAKLVEGALIDSEGKSFELNVADIIDSADFSDKNAAYVEKVQKCIVGNPSVKIKNSVAVMTAQVDATSYVQSNIIDAIKKELTKQGAASIIDDIDFSMLEKKGTFTAAVDGDSIENTAANKAAGTANTIRVKGAVFVDSEGNQVATYADAKAYAASTVQQLKVEITKKAAAANLTVNLDNLLATYQKKVEKAFSYADKAITTSAHKEFATADETLAWLKVQKDKRTTRFDVPGSVADLAKYGDTLNKAVAEVNKAFQNVGVNYTVDVSMDDVISLLNSGSDFVANANADTNNVYTVTFKVPDENVDADYFSTVEGIEKYYAAHPDQAKTDGVTEADYSQLVYDSSYKLVTAQGDADNDTLAGVPSGYFNVERIIKFKKKSTTTTTTTATGVSGTTTTVSGTDVSGGTTTTVSGTGTDVSGGTTTTVSGTGTDVSGGTTTTVSGTGTDVSGGTTTTVSGTGTDVSGGTTTTVSGTGTDVSGGTTTTVSGTGTDVSGGTTTTVSGTGTDVSGSTTTTTTTSGSDSETTTTTTTTNTGTITPVGTTTLEVEVNPTNFYFSVDERELKPSDLFSKFDIVDEEGTHFDALEAGAVTLDKTTPKEIFDAEGKPYCVTEVNAYFTDPTKADAEPVAAPVNPTVYIGVKGDTDLSGLVDVPDAVAILTYTAKIAAGQENVVFNEDENLNKFAFFLADVDTESKEGKNDGNKLMTTEDAVRILTYTAKTAAGQEPTWPDVVPSLKSLEGSIWYEG